LPAISAMARWSSLSDKSMARLLSAHRAELRQGLPVVETLEFHLQLLTDFQLLRLHAHQAGNQPYALLQLDQANRVGVIERRDFRVMHHDKGIQAGLAAGFLRVPLEAVALDAHRRGRVAQRLAIGAALDQQLAGLAAIPEEPGVIALARQRALGLGRFLRLGFGL